MSAAITLAGVAFLTFGSGMLLGILVERIRWNALIETSGRHLGPWVYLRFRREKIYPWGNHHAVR